MTLLERVARALCRHDGHPENATMDGKPLWQDYLPEARVAIEAMREPTEDMLLDIIYMTKRSLDDIPAERDRPAIEITTKMERAGINALDETYDVLAPHQIVAAVYIAMLVARDQPSSV